MLHTRSYLSLYIAFRMGSLPPSPTQYTKVTGTRLPNRWFQPRPSCWEISSNAASKGNRRQQWRECFGNNNLLHHHHFILVCLVFCLVFCLVGFCLFFVPVKTNRRNCQSINPSSTCPKSAAGNGMEILQNSQIPTMPWVKPQIPIIIVAVASCSLSQDKQLEHHHFTLHAKPKQSGTIPNHHCCHSPARDDNLFWNTMLHTIIQPFLPNQTKWHNSESSFLLPL